MSEKAAQVKQSLVNLNKLWLIHQTFNDTYQLHTFGPYSADDELRNSPEGRDRSRGGLTSWPPRSLDLPPINFLNVATPEGGRLCSPSQDYRRPLARFKTVVTTADASVLKRVRENAVFLDIGGGHFEYLLQTPGVHGLIV
jgi:hypothetical protein